MKKITDWLSRVPLPGAEQVQASLPLEFDLPPIAPLGSLTRKKRQPAASPAEDASSIAATTANAPTAPAALTVLQPAMAAASVKNSLAPLGAPQRGAQKAFDLQAAAPVAAPSSGAGEVKTLSTLSVQLVPRQRRSTEEVEAVESRRIGRLMVLHEAATEIEQNNAWSNDRVGYLSSAMVQITLPHSDPGNAAPVWGRTNGNRALLVMPGYRMAPVPGKTELQPVSVGYPYGSIPRLILAWVGKEAKEKKSRYLMLGSSLASFMHDLGYDQVNGGERGNATRVREQIQRLFSARIVLTDTPGDSNVWNSQSFMFADKVETWWSVSGDKVRQASMFESRIELSERFFDEIMRSPVPLDMLALRKLKSSPMALDAYCWVSYRASSIRHPTRIRWRDLQQQFGSGSDNTFKFNQLFRAALTKVAAVYPQAKFDSTDREFFTLMPSAPHVPRRVSSG